MNILVCVKQVPNPEEPRFGTPQPVPLVLNPFDGYALEAAARLKDADPEVRITALNLGPQPAEEILRTCLSVAADKVCRVWDDCLEGGDALADSYALSLAVRKLEELEGSFDAIFCGKQTVDGESGQIGPQLAQRLGRPLVGGALEAEAGETGLTVRKETENGSRVLSVSLPCVVTFTKSTADLRYPILPRQMAANRAQIPLLTAADLPGLDRPRTGETGSAIQVVRVVTPQRRTACVTIKEKTAKESAQKLCQLLLSETII